jgi:hypothetical protein
MRPEKALRLIQSALVDEVKFAALKKQLSESKNMKFVVATDSMLPCISPGEEVEIEPITTKLKRFDIIVFRDGKSLVCHVFWHRNSPTWGGPPLFVARALDTRLGEDLPTSDEALLGKVVSHRLGFWQKCRLLRNRS